MLREDKTVAELILPRFVVGRQGATREGCPVLVQHSKSLVTPEVHLLTCVSPPRGDMWTVDLADAVGASDAGVTLRWITALDGDVLAVLTVNAGRDSRTEMVRISEDGRTKTRRRLRD